VANLQQPYINAGTSALTDLNALLGISTPATQGSEGVTDWAAYVAGNPDAMANWNAIKGTKNDKFGGDINAFGQYHWQGDGARRDLTPFQTGATAGTAAVDGSAAQSGAIASLMNSPLYESLFRNGEQAILQNGSATGGLRGGNIQGSLANFGRDTLSQVIQNQIANLSGVAGAGQNASNVLSAANQNTGQSLAGLYGSIGDTNAGGILQRGAINANTINQVSKGLGSIANNVSGAFSGGGIKF